MLFLVGSRFGFKGVEEHGCKKYSVWCNGRPVELQVLNIGKFWIESTFPYQVTVMYWHTPTATSEGEVELYFEPDSEKFVMGVLEEFDLDICRMAIYDEYYYQKYETSY